MWRVRGLTGFLAALLFASLATLGSPTPVGACNGFNASLNRTAAAASAIRSDEPNPDDSHDPARPHADPGVWPELIFIVGLFAVAVVLPGSRPRALKPLGGPPDRRQRRR